MPPPQQQYTMTPGQAGFRLNPYERATLQSLMASLGSPGTADVAGQLGLGIIGGAQDRRSTNIANRQQSTSSLEQMAMQMAAQGASPDALTSAVMGEAQNMPGMGPQATGSLGAFVQGLYNGQDISGLAPADYRQQFGANTTAGLDAQDQQAVGSTVMTALQAGTPFVDIRQQVQRTAIGAGMSEAETQSAVSLAERMYEQAIGTSLPEMRSTSDMLRQLQSSDPSQFGSIFGANEAGNPLGQLYGAALQAAPDQSAQNVNVQDLMGQIVNQPGLLGQVQGAAASPPSPGFWSGTQDYSATSLGDLLKTSAARPLTGPQLGGPLSPIPNPYFWAKHFFGQ